MRRLIGKLKALTAARVKGPGMYGDGGCLYLQVTSSGSRSWIYRYWAEERDPATGEIIRDEAGRVRGRSREMGLGSFTVVSLDEARDLAGEYRKLRRQGIDPIESRRTTKMQAARDAAKSKSFSECAADYLKAHKAGWTNAHHTRQWEMSVKTFAEPIIGALAVQAIDTTLVMRVLEPIWTLKPETASRVRGRIEAILDFTKVRGYRSGDNPARWRGHLDHLLPARSKVREVVHHAALPYAELPGFLASLRTQSGVGVQALEWTILTAARTSETIGARWSEIDLKAWQLDDFTCTDESRPRTSSAAIRRRIAAGNSRTRRGQSWTSPGRDHGQRPRIRDGESSRTVKPCEADRSRVPLDFRDRAADRTGYANHVVEMALAHTIGDKTEAAYRRGDLFDKRRRLMADWAKLCSSLPVPGPWCGSDR